MSVTYIKGNLLDFPGVNVIGHIANCQGVMGSGLALQIKEEFPAAYEVYRKDFEAGECKLGQFSAAEVAGGKRVVNLYCQDQFGRDRRHLDYEALYIALEGLKQLLERAHSEGRIYSLGLPYKLGSERAGGAWPVVDAMIQHLFAASDIKVVVVEYVSRGAATPSPEAAGDQDGA